MSFYFSTFLEKVEQKSQAGKANSSTPDELSGWKKRDKIHPLHY
jgi:hypothetical protein